MSVTVEQQNARMFKGFALLSLVLVGLAVALVHQTTYSPAVSYIPLYLLVSLWVASCIAAVLLPTHQFTDTASAGGYAYFAAILAALVFFTGGSSSELYVLYFPLILAAALNRSWLIPLVALGAVLVGYALAMLPNLASGAEAPGIVLFRLAAFAGAGALGFLAAPGKAEEGELPVDEDFAFDPDGSLLLERVTYELEARRGVPVAVLLVDPGRELDGADMLLERVSQRIEDPILLGEGSVFGLVLSGADDRMVESAARRVLAAANSLGAEETRAGAAIYPRDARTAQELLLAAGRALEAAFEVESPSAIVIAGKGAEPVRRAAQ
jgi:hypothetical protein